MQLLVRGEAMWIFSRQLHRKFSSVQKIKKATPFLVGLLFIVKRCTPLLYNQDNVLKFSVLHWVVAYWGDNKLENIMRFLITADSKPDLERGGGAKLPNKRLLTMQGIMGMTALHVAVEEGKHLATKLLLEADRDFELLRMVDYIKGQTCLHIAADKGDHVSAKFIITKARPDIEFLKMMKRESNQTALHIAVEQGNLDLVKLMCKADVDKQLLSMPDSQGNTPLHLAMDKAAALDGSGSDSLFICNLLLEKDPSQCTKQTGDMGWAPLHFAASYGLNSVVMDIIRLCPDCINTVDFHGQNVLHIAAYHAHPDVVQQFLERDVVALLNTQDEDGNTPLHLAVYKGNVEVVGLLLKAHPISEHKANNISTKTPYMMGMGKILSHKYGEGSKSGGGAKIPNKRLLTMQNKYGDTALHLAVAKRNHEVTSCFSKQTVNLNYCRWLINMAEHVYTLPLTEATMSQRD